MGKRIQDEVVRRLYARKGPAPKGIPFADSLWLVVEPEWYKALVLINGMPELAAGGSTTLG